MDNSGQRVRACLRAGSPPGRVEIVANGRVIADGEGEAECIVGEPAWVAARCHSTLRGFAHTSPREVGSPAREPSAATALIKLVSQTREWIEANSCLGNPKRRAARLANCDSALAKLE